MSVATLYLSVKEAVDGDGQFDLLGSEVGGTVSGKLETVPKINTLLGDAWKVTNTTIPKQRVEVVERVIPLPPTIIPPRVSTKRKKDVETRVVTFVQQQHPGRVIQRSRIKRINVLREFQLDGKIGEDIQVFGHFWSVDATLKFYVVLGFKPEFLETFFENAYWPERKDCSLTKPRVLIFSHQTRAFHRTWEAGIYLVTDLAFGAKLTAATTNPSDVFFFGGSIGFSNEQFTFDLCSWPEVSMTFEGGKVKIEKVRLFAKTSDWEDGVAPRTIEGDLGEAEPEEEDETPDPHDVQFSLGGNLQITDTFKPLVWTPLPPDKGVACWNLMKFDQKLPKVSDLDPLIGEQAWAGLLSGGVENYVLEDLTLVVQMPTRALSSVSYTLQGPFYITGAAPERLTVDNAKIYCIVTEPGKLSRMESVRVEGTVTADGASFHAHYDVAEKTLHLDSVDDEGFDQWSAAWWYRKALELGSWQSSDIEGVYTALHVRVDFNVQKLWTSVSKPNGDSRGLL
jgi:hypothetical protein